MQNGRVAESEEDEAVFLSPEWDPVQDKDQGASPQLRRSARKRKSTTEEELSKNSKKKKSSPKMPKVPRSPASGGQPAQQSQQQQSFEALLLAMENRITAKIEKVGEASREAAQQAKLNCEGLELLEARVDAN